MIARFLLSLMMVTFLAGCDAKSGGQMRDHLPQGALGDGNSSNGNVLYRQHCSGCHGETGKGDGPGAKNINPKPADHTNPQYMAALSDEHLFMVVRRGGAEVGRPAMPPFPNLSDSEIKDLIAYMRSISRK